MSDFGEKLGSTPRSAGLRARATLKQLNDRWGTITRYQGATTDSLVFVGMDGLQERWTRISGSGLSALYELEGKP